jgi:ammonia channel protein AmtB
MVIPLRATTEAEAEGLDQTQHGEEGYSYASGN